LVFFDDMSINIISIIHHFASTNAVHKKENYSFKYICQLVKELTNNTRYAFVDTFLNRDGTFVNSTAMQQPGLGIQYCLAKKGNFFLREA
jgi:hypothetical protein